MRLDVEDPRFGALTVAASPDRVDVRGAGLPEVVVERTGDPVARYVPIGTRDPAALRFTVDGTPQELTPSPGKLTRGSYRVRARVHGRDLLLTPSTPTTSRLVRGVKYRGDNEIGVFERGPDALVTVEWSAEVSALGVTVAAAEPTAVEAAVGYALAAAFGTGAKLLIMALLEGTGDAATPW